MDWPHSYCTPTDESLDASRIDPLTYLREAFLGVMRKNTPQVGDIPVIALHTALEEDLPEKEGVISVPWPCETKVLVGRIEAALLDVPAASSAPTTQARPG